MDQHRTSTPTLDAERTDQLRTFLTVEAAADAAAVTARAAHRGRRRLVGGLAAALVLGGGLFAAAAIAGGPSSGPASVQTASAVAIEPAGPGWTKIAIADVDADPDAVVAQLRAAGIDARRESLDVQRDAQGRVMIGSSDDVLGQGPDRPAKGHGFTMVGVGDTGEPGDQGLAGLSVSSPDAAPAPELDGNATSEEIEAAFTAYFGHLGTKTNEDGSLEIRNDAGLTVLVLTED